jgi:hypothetical protein
MALVSQVCGFISFIKQSCGCVLIDSPALTYNYTTSREIGAAPTL